MKATVSTALIKIKQGRLLFIAQEGYGITLDKHALKTPSKNPLVLPSKALALAVAAEWRWQVI